MASRRGMLISTFLNVSKISWFASSSLGVFPRSLLEKGGNGFHDSFLSSSISLALEVMSCSWLG